MEFRDGIYQLYDLQVLLNLLNDIPVRSQGIVQGEGTTNFFFAIKEHANRDLWHQSAEVYPKWHKVFVIHSD